MMFLKYAPLAAGALLLAGAAQAQIGVTADLGTTGAGFHLVVPMESNLNGRFGANMFNHDFDRSTNGVDYAIKGKLRTFDVLFDWYVREGSPFHLTGGLVYNGNRFDASAQANQFGKLTLNGNTYTAADIGILKGRIDYRKAAPYLGIGWGNALVTNAGHWSFNADLGAFYQGNPNVDLGSYGCTVSKDTCDALFKDVAAERLRLKDDVSGFKLYPVARASLNYGF
ncbi:MULTISPECIES: hypothetical protein [unclassified Massilia]|uniref:hypothetical protein n=1 Tax=unclassified Massilia TaxID=2609279 RepID=UPI000D696CA6|nr:MULTISPECIES: hypothetical protein [unclassified Massilia]